MEYKCYRCKQNKPQNDFNKSNIRKRGVQDYCKKCLRRYREKHQHQIRIWNKSYREEHKEDFSAYLKKYRVENREKIVQLRREYEQKNKEKNNKYRRDWIRNSWKALRDKIITNYGGMCARCGFPDWRALQIDHIYGGGSREKKNYQYYKNLATQKMDNNKYQLLCANCNWIKRYEQGEYQ